MKENRGETLRIAERWEVRVARAEMGAVETMGGVGMVRGASRTGRDGSGGNSGSSGNNGKVTIVLINRIINFGKGCSLISY